MPSDAASLTVAIVSTQQRWHGGEGQAGLLALGLRRRGHRCLIMARHGGAFARRMADEGFEVVSFAGRGWNPAAIARMRRALRRVRPDVLHYNDSHAMTGAGLAAVGLGIPARIMARRVDFPVHSAWRYRLFCDRVFCVSRAVRRVCREGGIPERLLSVVHEGVDPSRVRSGDRRKGRQSLGLDERQPLLLVVAKLTDHKGHRYLLDAMPIILEKHPRAVLALAGDGELRETLHQQAQQLNILSHVRFLGYRDDVPDLVQAADAVVQPSHLEGLCTTLIDVMLAGQTIVATTAGGIPDLTGADDPSVEPVAWNAPPRDPPALARAVLDALAAPAELRAAMQQRARQRAESLFTADHMVEAMLALYRDVLGQARQGPTG